MYRPLQPLHNPGFSCLATLSLLLAKCYLRQEKNTPWEYWLSCELITSILYLQEHPADPQDPEFRKKRARGDARGSYQFLVHHVAPVDGGLALSADQVVDVVGVLSQLKHSVA